MKSYIIEGRRKLEGEVYVSGSKNASLPIIAACILNKGVTKLYNVPKIEDTKIMFQILKNLGCIVKKNNAKVTIDARNIKKYEIPEELMRKMRSSVILSGAILGRCKKVVFTHPGGCDIGSRPIDLHLFAFEKLGINVTEVSGHIECSCDTILGAEMNLDFPSVRGNGECNFIISFGGRKNSYKKCSYGTRNSGFTRIFKQNGSKDKRSRK